MESHLKKGHRLCQRLTVPGSAWRESSQLWGWHRPRASPATKSHHLGSESEECPPFGKTALPPYMELPCPPLDHSQKGL